MMPRHSDEADAPQDHGLSSARDSLEALTLGRKSSPRWTDSFRLFGQKGALSIKAGLDLLRIDSSKADKSCTRLMTQDHSLMPAHMLTAYSSEGPLSSSSRHSEDSQARESSGSSTRERHHTLSPKTAITTLRLHMRHRSLKNRRATVQDVVNHIDASADATGSDGRPSQDTQANALNEDVVASPKGSFRDTHLAKSIVGSIKGLRRMTSHQKRFSTSVEDPEMVDPVALSAPLPSSPINIPTIAPALTLDLGPAAFMPDTFSGSPHKAHRSSPTKVTDIGSVTTGVPVTRRLHVPESFEESNNPSRWDTRPTTSVFDTTLPEHRPADEPHTPMPGTNFRLEVDGADGNDSNVFERSVESPSSGDKVSRQRLQRMSSLVAMAEAAALSHRIDDDLTSEATSMASDVDSVGEPEISTSPFCTPRMPSRALRDARAGHASEATIIRCPSDMEDLCRVAHHISPTYPLPDEISDHGETSSNEHANATSGPPSPDRPIELPLRLKTGRGLGGVDQTSSHQIQSSPGQAQRTPFVESFLPTSATRPLNTRLSSTGLLRPTAVLDWSAPDGPETHSKAQSHCADQEHPRIHAQEGVYTSALSKMKGKAARPRCNDPFRDSDSVLTDYDEFKTQQIFGSLEDIRLPDYHHARSQDPSSSARHTAVSTHPRARGQSHSKPVRPEPEPEPAADIEMGSCPQRAWRPPQPKASKTEQRLEAKLVAAGDSPCLDMDLGVLPDERQQPGQVLSKPTSQEQGSAGEAWKFSVSTWLQLGANANGSTRSSSPRDSVRSADDADPSLPPANTSKDAATVARSDSSSSLLPMGSPTDFLLRRSELNMRYNALQNEVPGQGRHLSAQYIYDGSCSGSSLSLSDSDADISQQTMRKAPRVSPRKRISSQSVDPDHSTPRKRSGAAGRPQRSPYTTPNKKVKPVVMLVSSPSRASASPRQDLSDGKSPFNSTRKRKHQA